MQTVDRERRTAAKGLSPVPFNRVAIDNRFWTRFQSINKESTIRFCIDKCYESGRIDNFIKAGTARNRGGFQGKFFNDSDVYKVIEGASYSLIDFPDPELEETLDEIIAHIASAQEEDGYLMTWYSLEEPGKRWTDMDKHEMYCMGHLIEAGIAYKQATGKELLFRVGLRAAEHILSLFGPGKRHWVPGHQEIELALVKLYRETGERRYREGASFFLEERGRGHGAGSSWDNPDWGRAYSQDEVPVRDLAAVTGHAVRAMYLLCAMTDMALDGAGEEYRDTLERLWRNITDKNLYISGGIGPSAVNEGFTGDYHLPNLGAYCETCASAGMVFWNHRMNLLHRDAKYADILEQSLYNGFLSGVGDSGTRFFYENPLASDGSHHRREWYKVSCCPTQIARVVPSVGGYVYAKERDDLYVNLFISGTAEIPLEKGTLRLRQETDYPWSGELRFKREKGPAPDSLRVRLPGWCREFSVSKAGRRLPAPELREGYLHLPGALLEGESPEFSLKFHMPVRLLRADERAEANRGRAALTRGPLLYCFEECDNAALWDAISLGRGSRLSVEEGVLSGQTVPFIRVLGEAGALRAVPYCLWDNREPGRMKVWVEETKEEKLYYPI